MLNFVCKTIGIPHKIRQNYFNHKKTVHKINFNYQLSQKPFSSSFSLQITGLDKTFHKKNQHTNQTNINNHRCYSMFTFQNNVHMSLAQPKIFPTHENFHKINLVLTITDYVSMLTLHKTRGISNLLRQKYYHHIKTTCFNNHRQFLLILAYKTMDKCHWIRQIISITRKQHLRSSYKWFLFLETLSDVIFFLFY